MTETTSPQRPRGRVLAFAAGAAFMCVASAGVGATAASLVTSAKIKDNTIVSVDVKNGGLTGADLKDSSVAGRDLKNGSVSSADVKDNSVGSVDIEDGTLGLADLSPVGVMDVMDGYIPSGMTVTGAAFNDTQSTTSGDFGFTITLPGHALAPLTNELVNFRTDGQGYFNDEANDCAGSANVPSAPAGQVCLYLVSRTSDSSDIRGAEVYQKASDQSFAVRWSDSGAGPDAFVSVVWAYTQP